MAVMPMGIWPLLEGEVTGVLAGDLTVMILERVEAVSEGEALGFLVRGGAMVEYQTGSELKEVGWLNRI